MRILGLDLSTHVGWSLIEDTDKLLSYGTNHFPDNFTPPLGYEPDYAMKERAERVGNFIADSLAKWQPNLIYVEQTNAGAWRTDQKQLEFIHYAVLEAVEKLEYANKLRYIDTSRWRSILSIKMSKEQRAHNKAVKAKTVRGKITPKHLAVAFVNQAYKLELLLKDNDAADAICIARAGFQEETRRASVSNIPDVNEALFGGKSQLNN